MKVKKKKKKKDIIEPFRLLCKNLNGYSQRSI